MRADRGWSSRFQHPDENAVSREGSGGNLPGDRCDGGRGSARGRAVFTLPALDCVVSDGVCWLADRSALAGSASRMIDLVRVVVNDVKIPLHEAVAMASANPARALGAKTKGRLEAGADADFVVLSPELEVRADLRRGRARFTGIRRLRRASPYQRVMPTLVGRDSVEPRLPLRAKEETSRYRATRSAGRAG